MAGFLELTLIKWASTACAQYPCGQDTWDYACLVSGQPLSKLPPHDTEAERDAYLEREGGLVNLAGSLLTSIGWTQVDVNEPSSGDIGVLNLFSIGHVCSIYTGDKWALRGNREVILLTPKAVEVLMVWRSS